MIQLTFAGVKWGVDPIESVDTGASGVQINLLDEQSGIFVHIPFTGDSLVKLMGQMAEMLTEDQRREVMRKLTNGIHLPGKDFKPEDIIGPASDEPS